MSEPIMQSVQKLLDLAENHNIALLAHNEILKNHNHHMQKQYQLLADLTKRVEFLEAMLLNQEAGK